MDTTKVLCGLCGKGIESIAGGAARIESICQTCRDQVIRDLQFQILRKTVSQQGLRAWRVL